METKSNLQKYRKFENVERLFGKSIYMLYLYYFCLVVIIGINPSNDIVSDILMVAILYLIPLALFIGIYLLIIIMTIFYRIKNNVQLTIKTFIISIKTAIALVPIFYFDNNLAQILLRINSLWKCFFE